MTSNMAVVNGFELNDLHSAAKQDDIRSIVRLLEEGANVDKRDPYGYTPLHWASQKGYTHVVRALLAAGANVNVRDKWRRTPLHRAAKEGHKDVVEALINAGAEINAQGDNNWTPLHCSSFHGQLEVVEMLLKHGADQNAKDVRGRTSEAVCEMGLYDVDQSVKEKIKSLLKTSRAVTEVQVNDVPGQMTNNTATIPESCPPRTDSPRSGFQGPAVDVPDPVPHGVHDLSAGSVAAAARALAVDPVIMASATASAASAAAAAETGVFALWDATQGQGGIVEEREMDAEDALWQEMWAALHVPDPDNPDNNLYSEVKTLRKDLKRLRSDVNDSGSDEGTAFEGTDSALVTAATGVISASPSPLVSPIGFGCLDNSVALHIESPAAEHMARVQESSGGMRAKDNGALSTVKRQRAGVRYPAYPELAHPQSPVLNSNNHLASARAQGLSFPAESFILGDDVVGAMNEGQLREQLRRTSRKMAEMVEEVKCLRERLAAYEFNSGGGGSGNQAGGGRGVVGHVGLSSRGVGIVPQRTVPASTGLPGSSGALEFDNWHEMSLPACSLDGANLGLF